MKKYIILLIMVSLFASSITACSKSAVAKDDKEKQTQSTAQNNYTESVEKSRLEADKRAIAEVAYAIKIACGDMYEGIKVNPSSTQADSQKGILIEKLFDTTNEEGREFVELVEKYVQADAIPLSSKIKEDCTVQIVAFEPFKGEFIIQVISKKNNIQFYFDKNQKVYDGIYVNKDNLHDDKENETTSKVEEETAQSETEKEVEIPSENIEIKKELIKELYYDGDDSLKYYFEYTYDKDSKAQLVNRLYCEAGKDAYIEREYTYDKNGNCIKEVEFYSDGEFDVYNYEYDSRGNLVCEHGNDGGEKYRFEYKFDSKDNLIEQIEYDDKGNVEYYRKGVYEYDGNGRILELHIFDENNEVKQKDKYIYNSVEDLAAIVSNYYEDGKMVNTRKVVFNYYETGQVSDEQMYVDEKQVSLTYYDQYGNIIERNYSNESGDVADVTYYSRIYDSDGNLRSVAIMDNNGVKEVNVYEYSINKDIKPEVLSQYWYKCEYAIGGYTRYKFNADGTYESLWLSDYSPNNKIMKGTYKIEDDRIVIDDSDYFYDGNKKTFSYESVTSSGADPLYGGGAMKFSLIPSKICYEEYSDEMDNALRNSK